jgi:hypothetical protein
VNSTRVQQPIVPPRGHTGNGRRAPWMCSRAGRGLAQTVGAGYGRG